MTNGGHVTDLIAQLEENNNQQIDLNERINGLRTELAGLERDGRRIKELLGRELAVYGFIPNEPPAQPVRED